MTRSGIEPPSRGPLVNTQLIRPMARFFKFYTIKIFFIVENRKNVFKPRNDIGFFEKGFIL